MPSFSVTVYAVDRAGESCFTLVKIIPIKNAIEIAFSPKATFIATWTRHVKLEDDQQHKNLQIWSTAIAIAVPADDQGDLQPESENHLIAFTHKDQNSWKLQYTDDEAFALRCIPNEVHVLDTAKRFTLIDKLKHEGLTSFQLSPGRNPSVAIFVPERKVCRIECAVEFFIPALNLELCFQGMPASVRIHSLATLAIPSIQKSFFKADRGQMKWNAAGTSLLFLSSTDHDKTGKSYYGETNLYLMTPALQYEAKVVLDKEGGIGDFTWNPANGGKEFVVTYGYMPAKATLFDARLNVLHDFGAQPRNFVSFNPQGRLLCIGGFGNLAGQVDIWDRSTLKKVSNFRASNCTECTWSADGRLLMCATLSPRLRVDNGVKIHHWSGELVHMDLINECYQATWRPADTRMWSFPRALSPAPRPSAAVQAAQAEKAALIGTASGTSSPQPPSTGAYRPPGLRGREVPAAYRFDEYTGAPSTPSKQSEKPPIPGLTGRPHNGQGRGRDRVVPGAGPPIHNGKQTPGRGSQGQQPGKKNLHEGFNGTATPSSGAMQDLRISSNEQLADASEPSTPAKSHTSLLASNGDASLPLTPEDKKRRALQKKLGAIEQLKGKLAAGDKMEKTQLQKIEAEDEVRRELESLGGPL